MLNLGPRRLRSSGERDDKILFPSVLHGHYCDLCKIEWNIDVWRAARGLSRLSSQTHVVDMDDMKLSAEEEVAILYGSEALK